jgi:hypothetical protein
MMHIGLGEAITPPAYPALPSGTSAYRLMTGDPMGIVGVVGHTLGRSVLVGTGMAVAGERKHLVRNAVAGALGIEAFVLAWAAWKAYEAKNPPAPGTTQGFFP